MPPLRCSLLLLTIILCSAVNEASEAKDKEIREFIVQLGDEDFQRRDAAMQALIKAGLPAVEAISAVVGSKDVEVDQRARQILTVFFESDEDATHDEALRVLQKMSRSENAKAARFANSLLATPKELLLWIKQLDGEFTVDSSTAHHQLVDLRLDRTRGIDPGFHQDRLRDEDLARLKPLRDLRSLTLEYRTTMTDAGLRHVAKLKRLESLNLSRTHISGYGLAELAKIPDLRVLNLARCPRITDDSLRTLRQLKQLCELNLDGTSSASCSDDLWMSALRHRSGQDRLGEYRGGISDIGLKHIGEVRGLTSLSLERTRVTNAGLISLRGLPQLQSLDLSRTVVDDDGLANLETLSQLKTLRLDFTPITSAGLSKLETLTALEELHLCGTAITDAGLRNLVGLQNIRTLDLYGTAITDASVDVLEDFPNLVSLNVGRTRISFPGLVRLAAVCKKLDLKAALLAADLATADKDGEIVGLRLSGEQVEDADLKLLQPFSRLQTLGLSNTQVTDDGLAYLFGLGRLRSLWLNGTSVTDDGLAHLREMKSLEYLGIERTKVTFRGVLRLFTKSQKRSLDEAVQIAGYVEGNDEYPVLYDHDPFLAELDPENSGPKIPSENRLQRGRSTNGLRFLNLSGAGITDSDLETIAKMEQLGALFLHDNPITDTGLALLADCKQLEVIWVSGKKISGPGLASLAALPNLHTLWLTDTKIADGDLTHLRSLPKLRILNLSGAEITDVAVSHLQQCRSLDVLIVDGTTFSEVALKRLQQARPRMFVQRSQKQALAAVRGHERKRKMLPQGYHREEMGPVHTVVPKFPMQWIFGDAYFEEAETLTSDQRYASCQAEVAQWKHLTTLKQVNIVNVPAPAETVAVLKHLPLLQAVSFYRSTLNDDALAHLAGIDLGELRLGRTSITDAGLVHLKEMKSLKSLSLGGYGTEINDPGIRHLANLTNLESLRMDRTGITDDALIHLKAFKKLNHLSLREVRVDEGLEHISELENLSRLDLYSTFISDTTLSSLYGLKKLRWVELDQTMVTEEGVRRLRERLPNARISARGLISGEARIAVEPLAKLRVPMWRKNTGTVFMVDLRELDDVTRAMTCVSKLKGLQQLRLGAHATDRHLAAIVHLTQLEDLDVADSQVTDAGLWQLPALSALTTLRLGGTRVTGKGFDPVERFANLKVLDLNRTPLNNKGVRLVGKLAGLRWLNLAGTQVTDGDVAHLTGLQDLETLALDGTMITDETLRNLAKMTRLRHLRARETSVSATGVATLKEALPNCSILWNNPSAAGL